MNRPLQPVEAESLAALLDRACDQLATGQSVEIVVLGLRQAARRLRGATSSESQAMLEALLRVEAGVDVLDVLGGGGAS